MNPPTLAVHCAMLLGVDAVPITVEATTRDASDGKPHILGLVDASVREAYHRVLHAFFALGVPSPRGVTTVNFAPATLKKQGAGFDLPLAIALAGAGALFPATRAQGLWAFGEVSLRGGLLPSRGAVSVALAAKAAGARVLLCADADAPLCATVAGLDVRGASTLADALYWLAGRRELPPAVPLVAGPDAPTSVADLADLRGHLPAKRALAVAAAGAHNLLFVGPPGAGKSALLRRLPGLLPPPTDAERASILQIYAAAGLPVPPGRPLRAPHHTSSTASLLGGNSDVRPGECTLAHHGVLFLDELPEFRRDALEALRQPLEECVVTVGRAQKTVTMPADFSLVAAMNPCPCGFRGHPHRPCICPGSAVARYRSRISGPLLDRIDLQLEVPALDPAAFRGRVEPEGSTPHLRAAVLTAVARQQARNRRGAHTVPNGRLQDRLLEDVCAASPAVLSALEDVLRLHRLSARARVRLLRIARTLADLDQRDAIEISDVLEAAQLRGYAQVQTV